MKCFWDWLSWGDESDEIQEVEETIFAFVFNLQITLDKNTVVNPGGTFKVHVKAKSEAEAQEKLNLFIKSKVSATIKDMKAHIGDVNPKVKTHNTRLLTEKEQKQVEDIFAEVDKIMDQGEGIFSKVGKLFSRL